MAPYSGHAGNADIRAGDDGDSVDAGTTAAFSYSVALIAVRVPWVTGRVTLDDTVLPPVRDPHFCGGPCQRFAVDHHGRHDACRSSPS